MLCNVPGWRCRTTYKEMELLPDYPHPIATPAWRMFLLGAIHCPQRRECCFAQVHDQRNKNLTGIFRSDHQLEGKPRLW